MYSTEGNYSFSVPICNNILKAILCPTFSNDYENNKYKKNIIYKLIKIKHVIIRHNSFYRINFFA